MPITRQSFFLPTQITGCSLWLDGADQTAEGMTLSGANVTSWKDKSGNGRHLSATSAYPTITSGGLLFNGAIPNVLSNATAFTAVNGINSFVVFNSTVAATRQRVFMYVYTGQKIGYVADTNFNTTYSGTIGGDGGVSYLANTTYIYGGNTYADSPFISHSENTVETQYSSTYSVNTSGQTQLLVGGQSTVYFTGTIKEVILYDAFITSAQRQKVEGYLAQKWSMTASLPTGHPGLTSLLYRVQQPFLAKIPYFAKFSPTQIPGCRLWLDAADASTVTTSGTTITAVSDKSTNATVLTSPAGFTYPNNTFNGSYPSFYNTSASGGRLGYNSSFNLGSQNTVFIVGQLTSPSAGNQFFDFIDGYTSSSRFFLFSSPNFLNNYVYGTNGSSSGQVSGAITTAQMTSPFCWSVALDTSTTTSSTLQYVNGTQLVQSPSTQGAAISSYTGIVIGQRFTQSSESVVGHICEFIIYNSVLTTTQRQQVESYLAQKWGLVSSLPTTNHIHNTFPAGSPTAIQPYVPSIRPALIFAAVPTYILKYTYTGSNQSFVVPSGVTSVTVYMWGAGGGAGLGGNGGAGCYVQGVLTVVPGETLTIVVGQGGGNKARALGKSYGGGGAGGGPDGGRSDIPSSQGGGRSAIVRSSTDLVTAGAGGGGRGGRGGRGRLVTGENGTGQATGGTQSAGGTNNGGLYTGGDANQDNSAAGGSGYYGGGGGGQDQAGGGGSCLTSNLSLIAGQSTFGTESSDGSAAPQTSSPYYNSDVGFGATSAYGYNYGSGGNGLVVIGISSKTAIASVSYSRLILSAWFGSVAYRYGLDVTTVVNNAFGGNPSNTITLNVATLTNPQIGTTKYTYIVYMFNGIQKFSSPYAEGTVLTFSSLT